jgi:hypothetical protein
MTPTSDASLHGVHPARRYFLPAKEIDMTMITNKWEMQCPSCGQDDALHVYIGAWAALLPEGSEVVGDQDFDHESRCECRDCGWDGTAGDAFDAAKTALDSDDEPEIVGTFEPSPAQRAELAAMAPRPDRRLPGSAAARGEGVSGLDARELGTVLAALRHWQDATVGGGLVNDGLADIATDGGTVRSLDALEIDALCERLNWGGEAA